MLTIIFSKILVNFSLSFCYNLNVNNLKEILMRHVTRFSTHYINSAVGWVRKNLPYDGNGYTFTHPARTKYLEVLNYIAANPGCKRIEIIKAVWPRRNNFPDSSNRGFSSNLFSNMLYADLIDYNSKYEYIVRPWG